MGLGGSVNRKIKKLWPYKGHNIVGLMVNFFVFLRLHVLLCFCYLQPSAQCRDYILHLFINWTNSYPV